MLSRHINLTTLDITHILKVALEYFSITFDFSLLEASIVLCIAGIHVIARSGSRLNYLVYNLSSGKVEQNCLFPTDASSFLGLGTSDIKLHNSGSVSSQSWYGLSLSLCTNTIGFRVEIAT